ERRVAAALGEHLRAETVDEDDAHLARLRQAEELAVLRGGPSAARRLRPEGVERGRQDGAQARAAVVRQPEVGGTCTPAPRTTGACTSVPGAPEGGPFTPLPRSRRRGRGQR